MTKLEAPLRRELTLGGDPYTLTITPDGLTLVPKGRRKGYALSWRAFIDGDAALAVALNASLAHGPSSRVAAKPAPARTKAQPQPKQAKVTVAPGKRPAQRRRSS